MEDLKWRDVPRHQAGWANRECARLGIRDPVWYLVKPDSRDTPLIKAAQESGSRFSTDPY